MARGDVTIGIDIGTTAVNAVSADDTGRVTARVRVGPQTGVPTPRRGEPPAPA
ncbi:xylulose kinase, partial [Mycobacterium tuberculosis]